MIFLLSWKSMMSETTKIFDNINTEYSEVHDTSSDDEILPDDNNGWTPEVENYLRGLSRQCVRYSILHGETSNAFAKQDQWISNLIILLPILMILIGVHPTDTSLKSIILGVIATTGALLGTLNKLNRFGQKSIVQKSSGRKYMELNGTIMDQLILDLNKRYNGVKFLRWCRKTFYLTRSVTPFPRHDVFR